MGSFCPEEYKPDHKGLSDRYSENERKLFYQILQEEHNYSSPHLSVSTDDSYTVSKVSYHYFLEAESNGFPINKHYFSDGYSLLEEPLDSMPLHINDTACRTRAVALWRLKVGK
jgi:hypothetical protein